MDARRWLVRASLTLGLVLIPFDFPGFIANAADFVKAESSHGTVMWVDRKIEDFSLNPNWKIVRVIVRLHDGSESRQTYIVDYIHNRSALVDADGVPIPLETWEWTSEVPERL